MRKFFLLFLLFPFLSVEAQQRSLFRLGIEYGVLQMSQEIDNRWEIRQNITPHTTKNYHSDKNTMGGGTINYGGLKADVSIWKERINLASGLRYTNIREEILPGGNISHLYLYYPSDRGIEFFRLSGIHESEGFVTIPLEVDFLILGERSNWQIYVKGGIQAGMNIHGKTRFEFTSREMEKYKNELLTTYCNKQNKFFSNAYGSLGLRLILRNGVRLSAELLSSAVFLSKNNLNLLAPKSQPGVQCMISFPFNFLMNR